LLVFLRRRVRSGRDDQRAFRSVLAAVEEAKEAAISAVPNPRGQARPLAEALFEFEQRLDEARARMASWPGGGPERAVCERGLDESLRRVEVLRVGAPELTYESLLSEIAELIDPLDRSRTPPGRCGGRQTLSSCWPSARS
jgi:hypothetical protein